MDGEAPQSNKRKTSGMKAQVFACEASLSGILIKERSRVIP